jgi:hypothetical protein
MSELKRVMNTLFKTELATQKVELGLIDDIKKIYGSAGGKFLSLESDLFEVKKKMLDLKQEFELVSSKIEKASQMAKDLGANDVVSILSEFDTATKQKIKDILNITSKIQ